jgi:hypothetical protein
MLTPGNKKLGGHLIWGFGLPSGTARACPGMTPSCRRHCYAVRVEHYRPSAAARYRRNLALSRRKDFARRLHAFLVAHHVRVVRIHTGGEFYSARYARQWLRIARRSRRVRFFTYTRAWRVPAIKAVLDALAALSNCRVWYSCDRYTGIPPDVPPGVRVTWLMTAEDDHPPAGSHLVFRVHRLRRRPLAEVNGARVCPAEDGLDYPRLPTCDRCGICWRPVDRPPRDGRVSLPVVLLPDPTDTRGAS